MQTETLDRLYLEWSQFTKARTARELQRDAAYAERDQLVAFLARLYPSHLKRHEGGEWEDDWRTIVCVHSPAGQLTWHIHDSELAWFGHLNHKPDPFADCVWDQHTTKDKYRRLQELPGASTGQFQEESSEEQK